MDRLKYNIKTDVNSIEPLIFIAKWLAIIPDSRQSVYFNYLHPLIVTTIIVASYIYILYGKLTYIQNIFEPTVHLIDLASDFSIMLTNVCCIITVNFIKKKCFINLFLQVRNIDREFRFLKKECKYPSMSFYIELILAHLFYLIYTIYDCTLWLRTIGMVVYKYYIMKQFQCYHITILSMLLRYCALIIRYRFETLNKILCKFNNGIYDGIPSLMDYSEDYKGFADDFWDLKKITKLYTKLSLAVDMYTETFGLCFVNLYIWIIFSLLMPIDIAMVYGGGNKQLLDITFGITLVLLCVLWILGPLLVTMAIFSSCEKCSAEAARTPNICYNLMHDLPVNEKHKMYKSELKELAEQANDKRVVFTAAGFFTVDYNVIFSMVGSITSYLIVLIQFHK